MKSPADGSVQQTISARNLWIRLLTARIETGEPYIIYIDTVNRQIPQHHKLANLTVKTSNLCSEITLPTGIDKDGRDRTAVCCLSSLNLEKYDEWKDDPDMISDVMRFLIMFYLILLTRHQTNLKMQNILQREKEVSVLELWVFTPFYRNIEFHLSL